MNQTQKSYAAAKAIIEQLRSEFNAYMEPHAYLLSTDKGIERYVEIEMAWEKENGWNTANDTLRKAESDMVAWAMETLKSKPGYMSILDDLTPKAKRNITAWNKLVELAFLYSGK